MSNKSYVAFLDILGFKDLVNNNSHEELIDIYRLFLTCNATSLTHTYKKLQLTTTNTEEFKVNWMIVSDSIILWAKDDMKSFINIIINVNNLISSAIKSGLPIRGAITLGSFSIINGLFGGSTNNPIQSFVGKSITDACDMEKQQLWSGCVVSNKCTEKYNSDVSRNINYPDIATLEYLIESNLLCKYEVPYKDGTKVDYVIDWPNFSKGGIKQEIIQNSFSMHNKKVDGPDVQNIIRNTISFFEKVTTKPDGM